MRTKILTAIAVMALAGSAQAANLVQNGDFSQNNLTLTQLSALATAGRTGVEIDSHFSYANAVTGWSSPSSANGQDYSLYFFDGATAQGGDADSRYLPEAQRPNVNFTPLSATSGAFVVLDGDPSYNGPFQQAIDNLVVGHKYTLTFSYANGELSNRSGFSNEQLTGTFGSDGFATPVFVNSHPCNNNCQPGDFSGWQTASFSFVAHQSTQVLSFLAAGNPAANLPPVSFLDNISLTGAPEPAVWGLMTLGFGAMGVMMRRRRKLAIA